MDAYERLGVAADATHEQIRSAYRAAARAVHPDQPGGDAAQMAAVNHAWELIGDPRARSAYDAARTARAPSGQRTAAAGWRTAPPAAAAGVVPTPRIPWKLMAWLAALGVGFVLLGVATLRPAADRPPDNLLAGGSCVTISSNLEAVEVSCSGPHDAVVVQLVPFGAVCPSGTTGYRDRQGMGTACVTLADEGGSP